MLLAASLLSIPCTYFVLLSLACLAILAVQYFIFDSLGVLAVNLEFEGLNTWTL
jgi:hypothetical protein